MDEAKAAADKVAAGGDPDDGAHVWRKLKNQLAVLLHDKCWFCETVITRSDNAVDHFRPKNRVSDAANPHTGYRWLAFDRSNFRYSCTFCNSLRKGGGTKGGKADRFPLLDESCRLYAPGALDQETPTLLDPCDINDWELLGCKQENGEPCPATQDSMDKLRAKTSIEIYHLDHEPTCKQRHTAAVDLIANVEQGKRLFLLSQTNAVFKREWKAVAKKIKRAIDRHSPYSGEMIFLLRGMRDSAHPWIQALLEG
ncbi:MAG TPA: hypothetical protein VF092_14550 [Longimicrobium sp.]